MDLAVVVLIALLLLVSCSALWWIGPELAKGLQVTVQAPAPVVVPAPKVEVMASRRPRGARMHIKLVSGSGQRPLGVYDCDEGTRQPSVQVRAGDGTMSTFTAFRQEADGTWIYRRVGVERER